MCVRPQAEASLGDIVTAQDIYDFAAGLARAMKEYTAKELAPLKAKIEQLEGAIDRRADPLKTGVVFLQHIPNVAIMQHPDCR